MIIKFLIVFIILIIFLFLLTNKEKFESNPEIKIIEDEKSKSNTSINLVDVMLDDDTLKDYLENKELEEEPKINNPLNTKLPLLIDNEYKEYNHELRKLIDHKKISQNYVIDLLKNNIKILLNKTADINTIK